MKHFICPHCQAPLSIDASGLTCDQGHHLDRAREGYINFLLAQHKNSREPGDAKSQLLARRHFLHGGYYAPLVAALLHQLPSDTRSLLDIGCGEGYFTRALAAKLDPEAEVYGLDIAKAGVRLAAKQALSSTGAAIFYGVASSFGLPLADASMALITRINAPSSAPELRRLLQPGGRLVIVSPADGHLRALRSALYAQVRPHPQPSPPEGFAAVTQARVEHMLELSPGADTEALVEMTPFAWRLSPDLRARLVAEGLRDRADFHVSVYTPAN